MKKILALVLVAVLILTCAVIHPQMNLITRLSNPIMK